MSRSTNADIRSVGPSHPDIIVGGGRGRELWGCVKGLLIKNSRTVPWRETYLGKL